MSKEEERSIYYNYKSPYIIIPRDKHNKDLSIEEEFDQFINITDTLKNESKGMINLYKSGIVGWAPKLIQTLMNASSESIDQNMEILFNELIESKKEMFLEVMKTVFIDKHNFLFVNIPSQRLFKNFDELIINDDYENTKV
jgi:hypothetical protein